MCREKSTSLLPTCGSRSSALSGCPLPTRPDNLLTATSARCCARRRTTLKHEGSNSRLRKKSVFDAQPLESVRENWVVPPGLRSFFPLFPALNSLRKKSSKGARSTPQALKRGHIFNDLTARLKRLRKKSHCGSRLPSAAKAAIDFATLTARLKPRPFKAKSRTRVFPQPVKSCPSHNPLEAGFLRSLLDVHRR